MRGEIRVIDEGPVNVRESHVNKLTPFDVQDDI